MVTTSWSRGRQTGWQNSKTKCKCESIEQKVARVKVRNCEATRSQTRRRARERLGLEHGNSVQTPAVHGVTDEELEPLLQVASCKDRADMTFIASEFRRIVPNTAQQSFAKLKRLVRNFET